MTKEHDITLTELLLIFVIGGVFGFIYEELFYYIDLGTWVKRGTTLGPWIPIYGFGAIALVILTHKLNAHPVITFGISCLVTGLLEYLTGYILFNNYGLRLWDYNTEIWNWGNIDGFICIRSVGFFGISALVLDYIIYPMIQKIESRIQGDGFEETIYIWCISILFILFILDIVINSSKIFE